MNSKLKASIEFPRLFQETGPTVLYNFEDNTVGVAYVTPRWNKDGTVENVRRLTCRGEKALDISGKGRTGPDGTVEWRLTDNVCSRVAVEEPVSFVATPTFPAPERAIHALFDPPRPTFLTVEYRIEDNGNDLVVTVTSWNVNGEPVGNIPFTFRAGMQSLPIVD